MYEKRWIIGFFWPKNVFSIWKNVFGTGATVVGNASVNTFTHREIPGRNMVTGSLSRRLVFLMSCPRKGIEWMRRSFWLWTTPSSSTRWRSDKPGESWNVMILSTIARRMKKVKILFSMFRCESGSCYVLLILFINIFARRNFGGTKQISIIHQQLKERQLLQPHLSFSWTPMERKINVKSSPLQTQ